MSHRKGIETELTAAELALLPNIADAYTRSEHTEANSAPGRLKPVERLLDIRIRNDHCVRPPFGCGQPVNATEDFRDPLSAREFQISGLCQKCQDQIFGGGV